MAGATRRDGLVSAVAMLWLVGGCGEPPRDVEARLAQLQTEEERLDAAFDTVEARLLSNQARLHLWQELARRHGEVSALQCRVTDEHLAGMARHLEHQARKESELSHARRLAAAETPVLSSVQTP